MRHQRDGFAPMAPGDVVHRVQHAVDQLLAGLAAIHRPRGIARPPALECRRMLGGDLVERQSLEDPEAALAQARLRNDLEAESFGERLGGQPGTRQLARVDRVDAFGRQPLGEASGLPHAGGRQRDVEMALDAMLGVPRRLAVPDHQQLGRHPAILTPAAGSACRCR